MALASTRRRWRRVFVRVLLAGLLVTIGPVLLLRWVPAPTTSFMLQARLAAFWRGDTNHSLQYEWTDAQQISKNVKLAVLAAEDQRFAFHHGFDFVEIGTVMRSRQWRRGASTISQQVAKNLFLWPGRSYLRKLLEVYFTVLVEIFWPKQRILEMYLNIAQFGDGVYGVTAASRRYFATSPASLTATQSALLAAVLPNPVRYQVQRPSVWVRMRQRRVLAQMNQLGTNSVLTPQALR